MKLLFIGGTGTISAASVDLAVSRGYDVTLLNRGNRAAAVPLGAETIIADINDESAAREALKGRRFDVVADFTVFTPEQAARDVRLFSGVTDQYIFISSASAYQKPVSSWLITESTPLANPYWQYSRDKIACEDAFMAAYRETAFPVTIVRPSHTYDNRSVPVAVHGERGSWQVLARMLAGKPVIVHGDGLSWWTFTHNTDFAKGFLGLFGNVHAIGESVHITSDEKITWNAAYEAIGRALGVKPNLMHVSTDMLVKLHPWFEGGLIGDKSNSVLFDNTKIKRLVPDFCAAVRYDTGVRWAVDYVMSHEECRQEDPDFDALCDRIAEKYEQWRF